jgi:hypothetical protein
MGNPMRLIDLPVDPGLPGLAALRRLGLTAIAALAPDDEPFEYNLRSHRPGLRAAVEVRTGSHHFAIKLYRSDPEPVAALHEAMGVAGIAGDTGFRVPPLLTWDRDLRVVVVGWLEGPTVRELISRGQGTRAGQLAASWIQREGTRSVTLGRPHGRERALRKLGKWVRKLERDDAELGRAARAVADALTRIPLKEESDRWRLVHGAFHDRNVLDCGDGPGVIDWERFGQGPPEGEAGMFLASLSAEALDEETCAGACQARAAFLSCTAPLLNEGALAWYLAASLVRKTDRLLNHKRESWRHRAGTLLAEAAMNAERALGG